MEPDKNVGYRFSKNRTEPNWPQNSFQKVKNSVSAVFKKNNFGILGTGFHVFIHSLSSNMIGSTIKVFFFMKYHCTSTSSESLWLTVSQTSSVNSKLEKHSVECILLKQYIVQKRTEKAETAVNFLKLNRKLQLFAKPNCCFANSTHLQWISIFFAWLKYQKPFRRPR